MASPPPRAPAGGHAQRYRRSRAHVGVGEDRRHLGSRFHADPANKGRFISTGLWAKSLHPNYFGEILLWIGVVIFAVPALEGWQWVALIPPVFVTLLLTKVSGERTS